MRWVLMLSLVMGCAAGAEMRPRGKRNSLRIETLEKRLAAVEGGAPVAASGRSIGARLDALDERISVLFERQQRLEKIVNELRAAP